LGSARVPRAGSGVAPEPSSEQKCGTFFGATPKKARQRRALPTKYAAPMGLEMDLVLELQRYRTCGAGQKLKCEIQSNHKSRQAVNLFCLSADFTDILTRRQCDLFKRGGNRLGELLPERRSFNQPRIG
jgi:hypothetical protein